MIEWLTVVRKTKSGDGYWDNPDWHIESVYLQSLEERMLRKIAADLHYNRHEFLRANVNTDGLKLLLPTAGLRSDDIASLHGGKVLGVPIQLCGDLDWPMLATPLKVKEIPER